MGFVFILNSPNCPSVENIGFLTVWKILTLCLNIISRPFFLFFLSESDVKLEVLDLSSVLCLFPMFANSLAFCNAFCDTSLVLSSVLKILYLYLCQLISLSQQKTFSLVCAPVFIFVISCFCFSQG